MAPFAYPQATAGLAFLADIFPTLPRFLPFSSPAEPGSRLYSTDFKIKRRDSNKNV